MTSHPSEQAQAGDEGSAVVEFVFLGVLLLVPLIYLTLMVARVQAGSYAVAQAAPEMFQLASWNPENHAVSGLQTAWSPSLRRMHLTRL